MKGVAVYAALVAIIVLGIMYFIGIDDNLMNYDEGSTYLYPSMMMGLGHVLYSDIPQNQPPILMVLQPSSVFTGRLIMLGILAIACLLQYKVGKRFGVGVFAVLFLLSSPITMEFGKVYMGDIPIMMWMGVVLMLSVKRYDSFAGETILGVCFGVVSFLAIMTKLQMAVPIAVISAGMFVLGRKDETINRYIIGGAVCVLIFTPFMVSDMFDQLFVKNFNSVFTVWDHFRMVAESTVIFTTKIAFMLPFAALGFMECIKRRKENKIWVLFLTLVAIVPTMVLYDYFNFRYFIFALPVLAILAGMGLKGLKNEWLAVFVVCLTILVPISEFKESTLYDNDTRDIVSIVQTYSGPDDYIYTDEPMISFMAKRQMPPMAHMWNWLGVYRGLNDSVVIQEIRDYKPKVVALVTDVPYQKMNRPRLESVFGKDGARRIVDYLDMNYAGMTYHTRNYQYMTIWFDPDFEGDRLSKND